MPEETGADHRDPLPGEVDAVRPVRGVVDLAAEGVSSPGMSGVIAADSAPVAMTTNRATTSPRRRCAPSSARWARRG